ncbi:fungal-specific transcription factor domain-containing protein [Mycena epipterygia]|nr:fungal-specific transcription factor domain-containing protein [Mycena epipterygia]
MALNNVSEPPPAPHPDDPLDTDLERKMAALTMNTASGWMGKGFVGKSSGTVLVKAAMDLKTDLRREQRPGLDKFPIDWPLEARQYGQEEDEEGEPWSWTHRRPEYWMFSPWSTPTAQLHTHTHTYRFPPQDLVAHLAELYFSRAHIYLPVLHRPTFERSVEMGEYFWDDGFAANLLLVCAIGSRWSNDPRVLPSAGGDKGKPHLDCGWEWFNQVTPSGKHFLGRGTLCDVQYYCLAAHFLLGSAAPQACWMLVGVGLRLAQDAGAHRRSTHLEEPSVERELWKRAFWVLVYLDRYVSSLMGRACAIQYDDFDVELPVQCDDECWEDASHPFQQPPGMPSRIAFFNALLRLNHILAFTLKVLYSLGKFRGWEQDFVADLDSALNRWRDQVPEHLSWDPARTDPVFFDQSVALHCAYCHLQILIHRSFIPTVRKSAPTGLPSMTVCTSAARACANMIDVQRRRKGNEPVNFIMSDVFSAALVLLLNVWSGKRTGLAPDSSPDLENVHKCMEVLRLCEDRWPNAGMLWDVLAELASVGHLPFQSIGMPFGNDGEQRHVMDSSTSQPVSAEEMLRMVFKSPSLEQTFASPAHDVQYSTPHAPASDNFEGGFADAGLNADVSAVNSWLASDSPFSLDTVPDTTAIIDLDMMSTWMNAPTGFEVDDWGAYFNNFVNE